MNVAGPTVDAGMRKRLVARYGSAVEEWLDGLPGLLAGFAERRGFAFGSPIPRRSMSALDESIAALLIEAIEPGTPLVVSSAHPAAEDVAELMSALHETGVADRSWPTVADRIDHLFDSSLKLYEWHPELVDLIPRNLYERGRRLAMRLAQDDLPTVLLHGDLTPTNILDGGAERGLVAIDPAPCLGDAAFDAVDLILWEADDLATIETRAEQLAGASGLYAQRLLDWCSAFAGMSALEVAGQATRQGRVDAFTQLAVRA
jgi:streptomycin 6-kinase